MMYLPTVLICGGKAGRLLWRGGITGCWLAATVQGAVPWILLLWWLLLLLLLLLLLVTACGGGGTVAAGWLTWRRFRSVTSSVLKLRRRCCRCTASFDDDASDNKSQIRHHYSDWQSRHCTVRGRGNPVHRVLASVWQGGRSWRIYNWLRIISTSGERCGK